jgi:hypothetical protein
MQKSEKKEEIESIVQGTDREREIGLQALPIYDLSRVCTPSL